ncbi:MAG TPA: CvpA family protein [Blastocatellia bacterium]|nr:CvpA family protein [Blastocatellia bacterium]
MLDYFVLIVVVASVITGLRKGLFRVIISLVSTIFGLVLAGQLYEVAGKLFSLFTSSKTAQNLLGFIAVFLFVLLLGHVLMWALRGSLKRVRLGWLDNALGAGFGLLRGWLICSIVYLGLTAFPVRIAMVDEAVFSPLLLEGTRTLAYLTSKEMREEFRKGYFTITGQAQIKKQRPLSRIY